MSITVRVTNGKSSEPAVEITALVPAGDDDISEPLQVAVSVSVERQNASILCLRCGIVGGGGCKACAGY